MKHNLTFSAFDQKIPSLTFESYPYRGQCESLAPHDMPPALLILALLAPSIAAQCNLATATDGLQRSTYEFTINLMSRVNVQTEGKFAISPLTLWNLLSTVSEGASGKTLEELQTVLRHPRHRCFLEKYYEISAGVLKRNREVVVDYAAMFVDERKVAETFNKYSETVSRHGLCNIKPMLFDNLGETADTINNYVMQNTPSKEDMVEEDDLKDNHMLLVDTNFFEGYIRERQHVSTNVSYFYLNHIKSHVVNVPYNDELGLEVVLPGDESDVDEVIDLMKRISLKTLLMLHNHGSRLYPRRFTPFQLRDVNIETQMDNIDELLVDMGLTSLFSEKPDLTFVSGVKVSKFLQSYAFSVQYDKDIKVSKDRQRINVNKPYLFFLYDKISEVIVFAGANTPD